MGRDKKGRDGLRRMTYEECVSAGFYPAWQACVLGLHGTHPDAPADRPEPVAAFAIEAGGGELVRFVLQGEGEIAALRHAAGLALTRHRRRTNGG